MWIMKKDDEVLVNLDKYSVVKVYQNVDGSYSVICYYHTNDDFYETLFSGTESQCKSYLKDLYIGIT